jgi:hypothetical protein
MTTIGEAAKKRAMPARRKHEPEYSFDSADHACRVEVYTNGTLILHNHAVERLRFGHFFGELIWSSTEDPLGVKARCYDIVNQIAPWTIKLYAYDPVSNFDYSSTVVGCWILDLADNVGRFQYVQWQPWTPVVKPQVATLPTAPGEPWPELPRPVVQPSRLWTTRE